MEGVNNEVAGTLLPEAPGGNAEPRIDAPAPLGTDQWVPAAVVQQRAVELGLSMRMLRRLSAEGLLAPSRQHGLGYGRGSAEFYPSRALGQLQTVAHARPHRINPSLLRHRVWWRLGGQLEEWLFWRRDRVADLLPSGPAWALAPALHGEFPDDREDAITALAAWWSGRHGPLPGGVRTLHDQGDRETLARLFHSLVLKDDLLAGLVGAEDERDARARLQAMLGERVDGEPGDEGGLTLGELLDRGFGKPAGRTLPGVPGELMAALFAFAPDPQTAATEIGALGEEHAGALRDGLITWAVRAGQDFAAQLDASPELAALMLLWWDRLRTWVPAVVDALVS